MDFIKKTTAGSGEIGLERIEFLLNKWLAENSQLEIRQCRTCTPVSPPGLPDICLWPSEKSDLFNKQFVCKNDTFDEHGRMVVFLSNSFHCELKKITADIFRQYHLFEFTNVHFKNCKIVLF